MPNSKLPTYPEIERRKKERSPEWSDSMEARMQHGADRMEKIEQTLKQNCEDTAEILSIVKSGKAFFRVLGGLGVVIKWAVVVCAGIAAIYAAWHSKP